MRLQGLALCLSLVACGGSSKHAQAPVTESATTTAPSAEDAPERAADAKPAELPAAAAPAPMAAEPATAAKPKTRGAQKKRPKGEDPDAGGE